MICTDGADRLHPNVAEKKKLVVRHILSINGPANGVKRGILEIGGSSSRPSMREEKTIDNNINGMGSPVAGYIGGETPPRSPTTLLNESDVDILGPTVSRNGEIDVYPKSVCHLN